MPKLFTVVIYCITLCKLKSQVTPLVLLNIFFILCFSAWWNNLYLKNDICYWAVFSIGSGRTLSFSFVSDDVIGGQFCPSAAWKDIQPDKQEPEKSSSSTWVPMCLRTLSLAALPLVRVWSS